ncbi:MAG: 3-hydroxyacyl-CoA dehydrogenase NAD-binding domain-containing protein [Burkholderiaceae bacterium]|nr:3-hydroxyacyl-CoA dehydrogenase NAD-binding domain-containing protein [Burkholderiaceae bacterium]
MTALYHATGPVAVLTLRNPPVNALGWATRQALVQGLARAQSDSAVQAIVITGAGRGFSGGADIQEFSSGGVAYEPDLHSVITAIEASTKPVVAALHGMALGGGLELALACHYRVAAPACRVALPEVRLGLLPGAGGTQRLPRALGVEAALNLIVRGDAVSSEVLAAWPGARLFDHLAASPATLLAEAQAFAAAVAGVRPLPLLRDLPCAHPQGEAYFQFVRTTVRGMGAPAQAALKAVDAVAAATTHRFDEGLARERALFLERLATPESRALRHLFLAERAAARIADIPPDTPQRPIAAVAVVGAGTMGQGIAITFLNAGIPVTLLETQQAALDRGVAAVHTHYDAQLRKGKLTPETQAQRLGLLSTSLQYAAIGHADLVIEAVFEDAGVKQAVFAQLDAVMKPGAILASNTSTLDLNALAACTRRPQDVVGLHFFSPAQVMQLLEVVRGAHTAADVMATAMALAKTIRKTAVVSGVCDGFIGNRMVEHYTRQAGFLLDEGCTPAQVDRALEQFGFAMGPFRMQDLAGNDIGGAIRQRRYAEQPGLKFSPVADRLCALGRFGQKTGAGWYDYRPGQRAPVPSPVVQDLLTQHRQAQGITPRAISDEEIVQRLVLSLVNEGARLLGEGIASKAGDIDVVYVTGYGFPAWRGGPMHYANEVGLYKVAQRMQRCAQNPLDDAAFWQPAPLLARAVAEGAPFR